MKNLCVLVLVVLVLGVGGCDFLDQQIKKTESYQALAEDKNRYESSLDRIDKKVADLDLQIKILEYFRGNQQLQKSFFSFSEQGYSTVTTNVGTLLVFPQKIEPFGTGSRLVIGIGNPLYMSLPQIRFEIGYKKKESPDSHVFMVKKFSTPIIRGAMTTIYIDIPDVAPDGLSDSFAIQDFTAQLVEFSRP